MYYANRLFTVYNGNFFYFGTGAAFFNFIRYSVAFFDFVVSLSLYVPWMICLVRAFMMYFCVRLTASFFSCKILQ